MSTTDELSRHPAEQRNRVLIARELEAAGWVVQNAVLLTDESEEIAFQVTDDRVIVFGAPSGTERSRSCEGIEALPFGEIASRIT